MESVRFKTGLFGFRRKQVLQYINQTCADYDAKLQAEEKLRVHRDALIVQIEENTRLDEELAKVSAVLAEKETLLAQEQEKNQQLLETAQEEKAKTDALTEQMDALMQNHQQAAEEYEQLKQEIAAKDHAIAKQTVEFSRLQEQVATLGETFGSIQVEVEQSRAMMDCMTKLHERNQLLSAKVARLEAQLHELGSERQLRQFEQATAQKQELIQNTENLFAAVRKEIQEALQSISLRIESETGSDQPGNLFVDMADL